jgi:hypothetical protein
MDEKCILCGEMRECTRCDEHTEHEGEPICDDCYCQEVSDAPAVIHYNGNEDSPQVLTYVRDDTNGDFRLHYHRIDGWRGYFTVTSEKYEQVQSDTLLMMHSSLGSIEARHNFIYSKFKEVGIQYAQVFCRTSNVCSSLIDIWVLKADLARAQKICEEAAPALI